MKTCVLIPSYDEAGTINSLVKQVLGKGLDVIVVDDGSSDRTAANAEEAGAFVLRHKKNKGKGASLSTGFDLALKKGYQAVITMDGDGQHSPQDLPKFMETAKASDADVIIGNRMSCSKNMPLIRWITNNLMSFLISIICWRNIRDSQCGFRLIKTKVLKELKLFSANYEIDSEIIIAANKLGFRIKFIPIQTIYAKQASQINPILDSIRFFKFIIRFGFPFLFNR